jgi:choice-of-anchor A domain-containing protein
LAHATANGTTVIDGTISVNSSNLVLTPNSTPATDATVIFTLDASKLSGNSYNGQSISNIAINVPTDVNYVINVINLGTNTTLFSGASFNSGSNDNQLLWNFEGSGTVNLGSGSWYGSILAPSATVTNNGNTTENGQVVANAFTDNNTELHYQGFTAVAVVVPEPMTFALWGVALCGAAIVVRRKLVSSASAAAAIASPAVAGRT